MDSSDTIRRRVNWTRTWLNNFNQPTQPDDFETLDDTAVQCDDQGVLLDPSTSSSFSLINDESLEPYQGREQDILSLSSQNPATDCDASSETDGATPPDPPDWCWICGCCHGPDGLTYPGDELNSLTERAPTTRKEGINYELAGRQEDNTFRDLRSVAKARNRRRAERSKYYGYKYVKPGQVDATHYKLDSPFVCCRTSCDCCQVQEPDTVAMSKKQLYTEAQKWPRPPTYHRRSGEKDYHPWSSAVERRQALWKHADFYASQDEEGQLDDVCSLQDNSIFVWAEEWVEGQIEQRLYDYCDVCDVEWGRCTNYHVFEVDNIQEIVFETSRSRRHKQGWKLKWKWKDYGGNQLPENRGPAVLSYGRMDWDMRPGVDLFDEDDSTRGKKESDTVPRSGSLSIRQKNDEGWEIYRVK